MLRLRVRMDDHTKSRTTNITFSFDGKRLMASVVAHQSGRGYRQACTRSDLEQVTREIASAGSTGITRAQLRQSTQVNLTKIQVALLFLKEHLERRSGRFVATSPTFFDDAMARLSGIAVA